MPGFKAAQESKKVEQEESPTRNTDGLKALMNSGSNLDFCKLRSSFYVVHTEHSKLAPISKKFRYIEK